jgi:hypothetical protein
MDSGLRFDAGVRLDAPNPASVVMAQNIISKTMSDTQRISMVSDFTSFDSKWAEFETSLTAEQIANLSKMSASDLALLELAKTYADQNPGAIPGDVPVAELVKDIALAKQVVVVDAKAQQTANKTRNTMIAIMSDAYVVAREVYRIAKARGRTPQNAEFLDRFGARFARGPQTPPPPTP